MGLVLATAVISTFATQHSSVWMTAAVVLGVLSNAETLAMSILLPVWQRDVKTLFTAWRIRTSLLSRQPAVRVRVGIALLLLLLLGGSSARAQSLHNITYVGGTALQGNGLHGKLSISSADTLAFEGPSRFLIPYDHVISYESSSRKKVHLGLLAEAVWRLAAPWPEAKQLSLSYRDPDDHPQVVVLEMSREDEALLVEVLKSRVPRGMARPNIPVFRSSAVVQGRTAEH